MKKTLMILGGVLLGLIALLAVGYAVLDTKGRALDRESKAYVDAAIPAIASEWDIQELKKRASPELLGALKEGDLEKMTGMYRRLGKLKKYQGCKGDAIISTTAWHGSRIFAKYVVKAEFERGTVDIKVDLIKHGDQWQLAGLFLNIPLNSELYKEVIGQ